MDKLVTERKFGGWNFRLRKWGEFGLPDCTPVDCTNDSMMVRKFLRPPHLPYTVQEVKAMEGLKRHTAAQKERLKQAKAFHKEYGKKLNNQATKVELVKTMTEAMRNPIHFNYRAIML